MIKVCLADSHPVVHFGVKSYFKDHDSISIVAHVGSFLMIRDILLTKEVDILILDLEMEGLSSIFEVKSILKNFPKTKIIIFGYRNCSITKLYVEIVETGYTNWSNYIRLVYDILGSKICR